MSVFELEPQPDVMGAYLARSWSIDDAGAWHSPSEDLARGNFSAVRPYAARVGLNRPPLLGPCRETVLRGIGPTQARNRAHTRFETRPNSESRIITEQKEWFCWHSPYPDQPLTITEHAAVITTSAVAVMPVAEPTASLRLITINVEKPMAAIP